MPFPEPNEHEAAGPGAPLAVRKPWVAFLLPFVVYMIGSAIEPGPETPVWPVGYEVVYTAKIVFTLVVLAVALPAYRRFPLRLSVWAPVVGVVGAALWIGCYYLRIEPQIVEALGEDHSLVESLGLAARPGLDAWALVDQQPKWGPAFLAVRLFGLVLVVPIIEEMFLRAWLMRYVQAADWWKIPFGHATPLAIALGTLVPMMTHPEKLAAAVWFSLVTVMMLKTKNIWDCVAAHMITNLLLGIYVLTTGTWALW
ncbi:CAAX amino terminal protease self- immunity [Pirellulimonas nuda]|uniref:CAAX amino terminal protease self-immunity n=1 Tax=Pirellulimonas nuda TaxID=2528009 RepID=A0A518D5T0_9BACT|nr:CAAX prenyl protease-related protein [Pirellulimonas nuda]QDU86823.1 CAAX amino terminal protease self- immunity [Pirellulimonas nuda]